MTTAGAPIVVGVDGSPASYAALDWAIPAAERRHRRLRVVHAVDAAAARGLGDPPDRDAAPHTGDGTAEELLKRAETYVRAAAPELDMEAEILDGSPAGALVAASAGAAIVVVGHRGIGGFSRLLVGSVGVQTVAHAHCPIAVVRPHISTPVPPKHRHHAVGRVLVGVDGSELSQAAIGFAFEEAALRGVGLTAVHTWQYPPLLGPSDALLLVDDWADIKRQESVLLAEALAGWQERFPQVPVRHVILQGNAATALIDESVGAELLVIGARGRGGFVGLVLGSVSQAAIHHACCPVVVIRHESAP